MQATIENQFQRKNDVVVTAIKDRGLERIAFFLLASHRPLFSLIENLSQSILTPIDGQFLGKYQSIFLTVKSYLVNAKAMGALTTRLHDEL